MKTERTNTCGNCKAWLSFEGEEYGGNVGECCLHPPVIIPKWKAEFRNMSIGFSPQMWATEWCLDHVAMDEKEGDTE